MQQAQPNPVSVNVAAPAAEQDAEVPDFEREFFASQVSASDRSSTSDDEDLNKCSDDNSDDGIGHF